MYTIIIIIIVLTSWYFLSEKEEESTSSSSSAQNNKTERNLISSKNISKKATLLKSQYKLHFKTNITIYISEVINYLQLLLIKFLISNLFSF